MAGLESESLALNCLSRRFSITSAALTRPADIEAPEHFDLLKWFNCLYFRGYFFSRPLSNDDKTAFLSARQPAARTVAE